MALVLLWANIRVYLGFIYYLIEGISEEETIVVCSFLFGLTCLVFSSQISIFFGFYSSDWFDLDSIV